MVIEDGVPHVIWSGGGLDPVGTLLLEPTVSAVRGRGRSAQSCEKKLTKVRRGMGIGV